MMLENNRRNPYIAGKTVSYERGFLDRKEILDLVETILSSQEQNVMVLYGQRRIGKSSILRRLEASLPSSRFLPIWFDLMGCEGQPLGQMLCEIAGTIAAEAGMNAYERDQFDN